jgi:hypothetical protein
VDTPSESPRPFRWNLARRHELGSLLEGPVAPSYDGFYDDLLRAGARTVALCGDSDLHFIGRSLESMFDLLSGILLETSWTARLQLLHFSSRRHDVARVRNQYPEAIRGLRSYLASLSLGPAALAGRPRSVAFVDVVSSGSTLGNLIEQLMAWSEDAGVDWNAVARRIRIVGITERKNTSPKTWRWQQHASWIVVLPAGSIKNVSVPGRMWLFVANEQAKTSLSYPPWRWGREDVALPGRDPETLAALRLAAALFDFGTRKETRTRFSALLAEQTAMRYRWFRSLAMEVKG